MKLKSDKGKPLLLRISFEDSLANNLQFVYQYLKAEEGEYIDAKSFKDIEIDVMSEYVMSRLNATGFDVMMKRIDPSQWTYTNIIDAVLKLEAEGYDIHVLALDYLLLVPTTGCVQGVAGADKKDLIRRIKNFCYSRNIAFMSPFQLSSEAKMLIRNGIPEHQFPKEIAGKGYYDGCKTIDQEIDLELFIHLFSHKRKKYLAIARGKHRIPTIIDDDDMYCMYRFQGNNIPLLGDVGKDDTSLKTLPKGDGSNEDLMSEVFG